VPTYRVNYEIVRHTLCVNVEADSKNTAARIVKDIAESKLGIGKCDFLTVHPLIPCQ
jgi:hypothetical protein